MISFQNIDDVRRSKFTGVCYVAGQVDICHVINGQLHRLNGPAIYTYKSEDYHDDFPDEYFIYDQKYSYSEFLKHPLVIEFKMNLVLQTDG